MVLEILDPIKNLGLFLGCLYLGYRFLKPLLEAKKAKRISDEYEYLKCCCKEAILLILNEMPTRFICSQGLYQVLISADVMRTIPMTKAIFDEALYDLTLGDDRLVLVHQLDQARKRSCQDKQKCTCYVQPAGDRQQLLSLRMQGE